MKKFYSLIIAVAIIMAAFIAGLNILVNKTANTRTPVYKVDLNRAVYELSQGNSVSADDYRNILGIYEYDGSDGFFESENKYVIRKINDKIYRIDYTDLSSDKPKATYFALNAALAALSVFMIGLLLYIRHNIIKPFAAVTELPYQLAKGNLTTPLKENKSRYFSRFIWGLDMLREELEQSRSRDIEHAKQSKTLLLSLSHDIKTPLSTIKLYSKALSKGLYTETAKQIQTAESINEKADQIEGYVAEIISSLSSDILTFEVNNSDFYISKAVDRINGYYTDKLTVLKTDFRIDGYNDCLISGDEDRLVEVLQNIIENAIKYGDGHSISLSFSDEEECRLITVTNSGCTLPDTELPHIFDSFWRGSNTGSQKGSGLGLYICRQLMNSMGGEIYAEISDGNMNITAVCRKA